MSVETLETKEMMKQTQADEFSASVVPQSERKSFRNILVIALGYVFVVTSMQVGGSIGVALNFKDAFGAILLSSVILAVLASIMGIIGTKSGLTFGLLSKYTFGEAGTWVPVVIVALTTVGWFSIDAYLIGSTTNALWKNIPIFPIAILGGIGMTITALKGVKWMSLLADIAVPLIVIFGVISMVMAVNSVGGVQGMMNAVQQDTMTFAKAVSLGVGSFAVGAVMFTPDITRFSKGMSQTILAMVITMVLGNSFVVFMGTIGAMATGNGDIAQVLAIQGLLAPAFLVMLLNIWSTAQGCVYSGSLSLSSATKISRAKLVIAFGAVGIVFALIGFYNLFGSYINFLASTVPPLAGIFFADYLFLFKNGYPDFDKIKLPKVNIGSFVAWIAGFLVSYISIGLPVVNAVVAAFIVKAVLCKAIKADAIKQ
ncbi:MAG TPA: cytosine permease [Peptococcaceae bacterium]|nr:cytosine permease [Peptococcaceae bacterium]